MHFVPTTLNENSQSRAPPAEPIQPITAVPTPAPPSRRRGRRSQTLVAPSAWSSGRSSAHLSAATARNTRCRWRGGPVPSALQSRRATPGRPDCGRAGGGGRGAGSGERRAVGGGGAGQPSGQRRVAPINGRTARSHLPTVTARGTEGQRQGRQRRVGFWQGFRRGSVEDQVGRRAAWSRSRGKVDDRRRREDQSQRMKFMEGEGHQQRDSRLGHSYKPHEVMARMRDRRMSGPCFRRQRALSVDSGCPAQRQKRFSVHDLSCQLKVGRPFR